MGSWPRSSLASGFEGATPTMPAALSTPRHSTIHRIVARGLLACGFVVVLAACGGHDRPGSASDSSASPIANGTDAQTSTVAPPSAPPTPEPTAQPLRTGAEVLAADGFALLRGHRVGLIANQTSVVDGRPLAPLLAHAPGVELVALFAPEHGFNGTAGAGDVVDDVTDPLLEIPVYSLYGASRAPTPEALADLDILVYDLQDVGARFYTYIATMGLAMQAAAAANVAFVVLDRPNPQGAELAGFVRDDDHESFVSPYPIPTAYAMTAGELARAIVGEHWLTGLDSLDLTVVPVEGWDARAPWPEERLGWLPPSPALPSLDAALAYPGVAMFEATSVSEGRGTEAPFTTIGAPWLDGEALAAALAGLHLPGVHFEPTTFTPRMLETMTTPPRFDGQVLNGVRLVIEDRTTFASVETGVHLLVAVQAQARAGGLATIVERPDGFDLLAGSSRLRTMLESAASGGEIVEAWMADLAAFAELREAYLLYR
jgi:uncharacterized protein YbbC (DUF1343 family)